MYKIIALIGKSGSGKDSIAKALCERNPDVFNRIVNHTTRPMRSNEIEGVDYFYTTPQDFLDRTFYGSMLEATCFNGWFYGTDLKSLKEDRINIGVFNPEGIRKLERKKYSLNPVKTQVYYIMTSSKKRLLRQLEREENPDIKEILRRFLVDEEDFLNLDFPYTEFENEEPEDFLEIVECIEQNGQF